MQKEENFAAATEAGERFADNSSAPPDPTYHHHGNMPFSSFYHHEQVMSKAPSIHQSQGHSRGSGSVMVDYMLKDPPSDLLNNMIPSSLTAYNQEMQQNRLDEPNNSLNINVDRTLSFADVMQFADFGPKLALNHHPQRVQHEQQDVKSNSDHGIQHTIKGVDEDPFIFLKFPVLTNSNMVVQQPHGNYSGIIHDDNNTTDTDNRTFLDPLEEIRGRKYSYDHPEEDVAAAALSTAGTSNDLINNYSNNPVQLEFLGNNTHDKNLKGLSSGEKDGPVNMEGGAVAVALGNNKSSSSSSKRKRPRTIKTNEEVESQRMTHIAVERNRRKQMNEHLRVLRSLMPSSYVQRGDQASIIGGAIEFVRELEQLLQCLESQKRRRLYGDQAQARPMGDSSSSSSSTVLGPLGFPLQQPPPMGPLGNQDDDQLRLVDHQLHAMPMLQEETAESKSYIADVEVKLLGLDALIKILSRRRSGQLIKAIAALEDLHFNILHTNITTIEQTVLYSFNVKVASEARITAEDIATSVQQIFTFVHANTNII